MNSASESREPIGILVADDHAAFRAGLGALLGSMAGLRLMGEASDGETAVARTTELQPDVVIMDLNMPGLDGIEATRRIRALPGQAGRVPVIGISGRSGSGEEAAARVAGMNFYFVKPVSPGKLAQTLAFLVT